MVTNKLIFVDGNRNVGKTFLIDSLKNITKYKFPFATYFNESYLPIMQGYDDELTMLDVNSDRELFYLTLGYDITILDLFKKGIIKQNMIVDRGILSDIVFALQSNRISMEEAIGAWNWLNKEYSEYFEIVNIIAETKQDNRDKDAWTIYNAETTKKLTNDFLILSGMKTYTFVNNFNEESVDKFIKVIHEKLNIKQPKKVLKDFVITDLTTVNFDYTDEIIEKCIDACNEKINLLGVMYGGFHNPDDCDMISTKNICYTIKNIRHIENTIIADITFLDLNYGIPANDLYEMVKSKKMVFTISGTIIDYMLHEIFTWNIIPKPVDSIWKHMEKKYY